MNISQCKKEWTGKFLKENFSQSFLKNKFKQHQQNVIFEKEQALLPQTQVNAEKRKKIKKYTDFICEVNKQIAALKQKKARVQQAINILNNENTNLILHNENNNLKCKTEKFIGHCNTTDCRGFLDEKYFCGLCENYTCNKCNISIGKVFPNSEHTCNPNEVESTNSLKKETKDCPKCHTLIYKIDGCDQMWCTQCHTAFSWNTRIIETKIHNPHYYEYMRQNRGGVIPREIGDVECGREINHFTIIYIRSEYTNSINIHKKEPLLCSFIFDKCPYYIQNLIHNREVEKPKFKINQQETEINLEPRIDYLLKEIDLNKFKTIILKNMEKVKRNKSVREVFDLQNVAMTDILHRFLDYLKQLQQMENITSIEIQKTVSNYRTEIETLVTYCNELFVDIKTTYGGRKHEFNDNLAFNSLIVKMF